MKNAILIFLAIFSIPSFIKAQPTLIGATPRGGNQFGTILSYTVGDTTFDKVYKFKGIEGAKPLQTHFISAGGKLYGMTTEGGAYNEGVIFEYNPITNVYVKKFDFNDSVGSTPSGSLMLASNGKMYGMTQHGGANFFGVIFEYDHISNTYVKKIDLINSNGNRPDGCSLIEAPNGKLYGMTTSGGANQEGVIFEYDYTTNIYTKKLDLDGSFGSEPEGSLTLASNGKLYGMTVLGGLNYTGVIFEYDYLTNVYTKKYDFITSEGKNPKGSLIQASNGKLYGVTFNGGSTLGGVLFEYDYINNVYNKKAEIYSSTGSRPSGSLFQATNGNLYGCTTEGGASSNGILFEYQINIDSLSLKADLVNIGSQTPNGSLFQASNGKLYGTSSEGGLMDAGTIFEYDIYNNSLLKKKEFSKAECSIMTGSLLKVSNGKYYGMTHSGGSLGQGTIFEYDYGSNEVIVKVNLISSKGINPYGSLIEAANGKLYGMTNYGGSSSGGVIFEYDYINNIYTKKYDLNNPNGRRPFGDLIEAPNNKLYGLTYSGGVTGNLGTLFEYDYTNNIYTTKVNFIGGTTGYYPKGSLMIASNGKMYGMTSEGGVSEGGTIFEYDYVNDIYTQKVALFGQTGISQPHGSLIEGLNNKLYGLTTTSIIEYDFINDTLIERYLFTNANGDVPFGSLMLASNNKMYGMTRIGGLNNDGVIFEYDYLTDTYTKVIDLETKNLGSNPEYTALVEVNCIAPYIVPSGPTSFCRGGNVTLNSGSVGSSYQWNRNGNLIPGANNSSLLVTNPGKYSVTVTDSNCVSTLTSNAIRVKIPCFPPIDPHEKIAAEDVDGDAIAFYSYYESSNKNLILWAENLKGTTYQISIFNNTGKLLVTENGNVYNGELELQLDCSKFASGLFIVKLSTNIEQFTKKFVKGN